MTTSAVVAAVSATPPNTSPVTPPNRRTQRRSNRSAAPAATATASPARSASDGPRAAPAPRAARRRGARQPPRAAPAPPRDRRAQPLRTGGRHTGARGQREGEPRRDRRHHGGQRAPRPGTAVRLRQRGHLREQYEHQGEHPERSDVRLLHDPQRVLGGPAAAQSVGGVGQPVQVQPRVSAAGTATEATAASSGPAPRSSSTSPVAAATTPTIRPTTGAHSMPARAAGRSQRVSRPAGSAVRVPKAKRRPSAREAEGVDDAGAWGGLGHRRRLPGGHQGAGCGRE